MAAALATLQILERDDVPAQLARTGAALRAGFQSLAAKHGVGIRYTGSDALPFVTFSDERNFYRSQAFCREVIRRGVFLHPHHNWFLSAAHQDADIAEALTAVDAGLAAVADEFRQSPR